MESLTLYRGDYTKIDNFELRKTSKWSLLGQGIYLTNDIKIAKSYKRKGSELEFESILFNGRADNRNIAYDKAFIVFCQRQWDKNNTTAFPTGKILQNFMNKMKPVFQDLIERKAITAEYVNAPFQKEKFIRVKVKENVEDKSGYLTEFEFDKKYIDNNVVHVDINCQDVFILELIYENKLHKQNLDKSSFIQSNLRHKSIFDIINGTVTNKYLQDPWKKFRSAVIPYGVIGLEYHGGARLGGGWGHRAFSIWDEEFVNRHKVTCR